jgi:hypothetical protein
MALSSAKLLARQAENLKNFWQNGTPGERVQLAGPGDLTARVQTAQSLVQQVS